MFICASVCWCGWVRVCGCAGVGEFVSISLYEYVYKSVAVNILVGVCISVFVMARARVSVRIYMFTRVSECIYWWEFVCVRNYFSWRVCIYNKTVHTIKKLVKEGTEEMKCYNVNIFKYRNS